jgi:hypothetical protein
MGRGLSELHRRILVVACKRRKDEPITYQPQAFWRALAWTMDLWEKVYDAERDYWKLGFLPTRYLSGEEGNPGWDFSANRVDALWDAGGLRRKIIEKVVEAAKAAGDPGALWLDLKEHGSDFNAVMVALCHWSGQRLTLKLVDGDEKSDAHGLARLLGMKGVEEFDLSWRPEVYRGCIGWFLDSTATYAESTAAEAVKDRLHAALKDQEEYGGAWVRYASGFRKVTYNELLAELFGFEASANLDGKAFDVQAIGAERYNVARASLQRACHRLGQRGLIERRAQNRGGKLYDRAGFNLTVTGVAEAERLLAADEFPAKAAA